MTEEQERVLGLVENCVAQFRSGGYTEMADRMDSIVKALHKGESVWAVILAQKAADDGVLGQGFVEQLRKAFKIGRIE